MPGTNDFFGGALADLYSRGMDISRDNPWALAESAFPSAQRQQPGITFDEILSGARNFFSPQPQARPQPSFQSLPTTGGQDDIAGMLQALEQVGETGPDVPMSEDVSLGGRLGLMAQLNSPISPANIALQAMQAFAGPGAPVISVLRAAMKAHNRNVINEALGKSPEGNLAQGSSPLNVPENDPTLSQSIGFGGVGGMGGPPGGPPAGPTSSGQPGIGGPTGLGEGLSGLGLGSIIGAPSPEGTSQDVSVAADAVSAGSGDSSGPGVGGDSAGGVGASGPSGEGEAGGSDFKHGGVVKNKSKRKGGKERITAHQGEFVVNPAASKAARPELEALNALIPPEALNSLVEKSRKFFDSANRR